MQHKQCIYYSASSLYMFRVLTTPIITSTQICNYSLRYRSATVQLPPSNGAQLGHVGGRQLHNVYDTTGVTSQNTQPVSYL